MTSETRTLIEAADITGVEVECPECGITTFYPLQLESIKKIGPGCPHCHRQFFDMATTTVSGAEAYPALSFIHGIIGNLTKFTQTDRTDIHANVRFRLNMEPKAE
jgi:transposase-like protein